MDYLIMAGGNLLFGSVIILIGFILGYFLYNTLVLGKIKLKDSLFEKDNLAAWIEFIGAFVFPALYLSARAIVGSADENLWIDLLICTGYAAAYVVIFTILRLFSGTIVNVMGKSDEHGRISLTNEIYVQHNAAAALFSVALSIIFVSVVQYLDLTEGFIAVSLMKMLVVLIFTLVAIAAYCLVMRSKTALFKEIFLDNNPAAGVAFAGFVFAVETLLTHAVSLQVEFNIADLAATSAIWLVLLGVLALVFKAALTGLIKVDVWKEVYEQNSIGAAIGQCALYIGIANVLVSFIK